MLDVYKNISAETSGAASKNRFKLEMLWGASKMFDLFNQEDFCVVFDYKCDIEVHLKNSFEFYQIKTHKVQSPYSLNKITKQDKTGASILGKLYLIKNAASPECPIKIAIVSNAFLKINNKIYSEFEELAFSSLKETTQKTIRKKLEEELGNNIDLNNISFIYTSMNLIDPDDDLKGKIIGSFEDIMGCEPNKPNALYRLIKDTVQTKACYELKTEDYNELICKKGITKEELYNMLSKHATYTDTVVADVESFIKSNVSGPTQTRKYKISLANIIKDLFVSSELKDKEKVIALFLSENQHQLPDNELDALELLYEHFGNTFSIEYSESDKKVFLLVILFKWESGKYE